MKEDMEKENSNISELQKSSQDQKSLNRLLAYSSKENIQINKLVRGNTQITKNKKLDLSIDQTENNDLNGICNEAGANLKDQQVPADGGSNIFNANYRRSSYELNHEIDGSAAGSKPINVVVSQRKQKRSQLVSEYAQSRLMRSDKISQVKPAQTNTNGGKLSQIT